MRSDVEIFAVEHNAVTTTQNDVSVSVFNTSDVLLFPGGGRIPEGIIASLEAIVKESFGMDLSGRATNESVRSVLKTEHLALLHSRGMLLGFASADSIPDVGVFYLHGAVVTSSFKGKGGSLSLARALVARASLPFVAGTTQNPIIFHFFKSLCSEVYPSFESGSIPEDICELSKGLIERHPSWRFNPTTFVLEGFYGQCLYPSIPLSRDHDVNAWFTKKLRIKSGVTRDAFLFIGRI